MASDWNVGDYEKCHDFVWKRAQDLVEWLAPKAGERILDVGCGTAHLTAQIAARGAIVTGLDASPAMLEKARQQFPELSFVQADARSFKVPAPVDAVFSNATLHWIKDADAVLQSIYAALKPGGRFIAEFGGQGNIEHMHESLGEGLKAVGISFSMKDGPWFFPSAEEYRERLESAGFTVKRAILFDRPTPLEGGEHGFRLWAGTFGTTFLDQVPDGKREEFYRHAEASARPKQYKDNQWWADYRRLRVEAERPR